MWAQGRHRRPVWFPPPFLAWHGREGLYVHRWGLRSSEVHPGWVLPPPRKACLTPVVLGTDSALCSHWHACAAPGLGSRAGAEALGSAHPDCGKPSLGPSTTSPLLQSPPPRHPARPVQAGQEGPCNAACLGAQRVRGVGYTRWAKRLALGRRGTGHHAGVQGRKCRGWELGVLPRGGVGGGGLGSGPEVQAGAQMWGAQLGAGAPSGCHFASEDQGEEASRMTTRQGQGAGVAAGTPLGIVKSPWKGKLTKDLKSMPRSEQTVQKVHQK